MKRHLEEVDKGEETRKIERPSKKVAIERQPWLNYECVNQACGNLKMAYMYEKRLLTEKLKALQKQSELEKRLIQENAMKQVLEAKHQASEAKQQLRETLRMLANLTKSQDVQVKVEEEHEPALEPGELLERDNTRNERSSRRTIHKFCWLTKKSFEIPTALLLSIASFLSDETLFRFREVNTLFYGAYYNQRVERDLSSRFPWRTTRPFNAIRAMKLALHGRRFPRVRFIKTDHAERTSEIVPSDIHLSSLIPLYFPFLDSIYLGQLKRNNSVKYLPGHPRVEAISTPIYDTKETWYINQEKFPNLKLLEMQSVTCEATVRSHYNLERINFFDCKRVRWNDIVKEKFPNLKKITKKYSGRIPCHVVFLLEAHGVAVEEVDVEL